MIFTTIPTADKYTTVMQSECGTWRIHHRQGGFGHYLATIFTRSSCGGWEHMTELAGGDDVLQRAYAYCRGSVADLNFPAVEGDVR